MIPKKSDQDDSHPNQSDAARSTAAGISVNRSGISIQRKSKRKIAAKKINTRQSRTTCSNGLALAADKRNNVERVSSTTGYCQEMARRQCRHFPRSRKKLTTGTLSYQASCFLQFGQIDRLRQIGKPSCTRHTQALTKLPAQSPSKNTSNIPLHHIKNIRNSLDLHSIRTFASYLTKTNPSRIAGGAGI